LTGLEGVAIGDTLADPETPDPLPRIEIDEPTVRMTFGVNTSPFTGREGKFSTTRQLRARLYKELDVNLGLHVEDTSAAERFLVSGRGELHLAVLIETMRREGYEFEVSRPEAIIKVINGQRMEPGRRSALAVVDELDHDRDRNDRRRRFRRPSMRWPFDHLDDGLRRETSNS